MKLRARCAEIGLRLADRGEIPRAGKCPQWQARLAFPSILWHAGLAQTGKIGGLVQRADFRYPQKSDGFQAADTLIAMIAAQPSSFGELGDRVFSLACEGMGRGEVSVNNRA